MRGRRKQACSSLFLVILFISACRGTDTSPVSKQASAAHRSALAMMVSTSPSPFSSSPSIAMQLSSSPPPARVTPITVPGDPVRLFIPSIGVNAPVEDIGVVSNGNLATPTQNPWDGVGWYHLGPHPGEMGSAVIAGHLDRPGGAPAVFWSLRHVHSGEMVIVVDAQGAATHFRVMRVAAYAPLDAPLEEIFANNSGKYLNLITCAGDWIPREHQTTLRLIVYTSLA